LRHTHTRHDARGADRTRTNADLDGIGTGLDQGQGRCTGGNVAANHFDLRKILLDPPHPVQHALAVAVGGVNHDGIDTGARQQLDAFFGALAHTHSGSHSQFALGVTCGGGKTRLLGDVLDRDETFELKCVIDHQQTLDLVLIKQHLGLFERRAVGHRDQFVARRHDVADWQVITGFEAQITPGDDAGDLARVDHRKTRHTELF